MDIVQQLRDAGFESYFAGGCVRDRLMGLDPVEYDIATAARPDDVRTIFPRARHVGEAFGVSLVRSGEEVIDVATFRCDGVYRDHRHPENVEFSDALHDAQRRDFTINGLFEDPLENTIIDHVGGQEDLAAGIIRAIGDPRARIDEDHLRMLRAVRFAARFDFTIEEQTLAAINDRAGELAGVSRERIGQEVRRMLTGARRAVAAALLQETRLDAPALNEPTAEASLCRLAGLPGEATYSIALAAWLLDRHGEQASLQDVSDRWRGSLMLSNRQWSDLCATLSLQRAIGDWDAAGVAARKRLAATEHFSAALSIVATVDAHRADHVQDDVAELAQGGLAPDPIVCGDDLVEAGMRPSPLIGRVLEAVYDAQLEGSIATFEEAMALAQGLARELAGDLDP